MNTHEAAKGPRKRDWRHYALRSLLIAVVVVLCGVTSFYFWFQHAIVEPHRVARQIQATIESLETKCPPSVRSEQWEIAIWWTCNLTGNSLLNEQGRLADLRRFQRELAAAAEGPVDMTTILWIWDEHARLTPAGKEYQRFRQIMLDAMQWHPGPEKGRPAAED